MNGAEFRRPPAARRVDLVRTGDLGDTVRVSLTLRPSSQAIGVVQGAVGRLGIEIASTDSQAQQVTRPAATPRR
jgi:hypothetical protein